MIRVMLVDDHDLVRVLMKERLERVSGIEVVAEAASGEDAVRKAKEVRSDVVLLDVNLPGIGGLETARLLKRVRDDVKIIIVSGIKSSIFFMNSEILGVRA